MAKDKPIDAVPFHLHDLTSGIPDAQIFGDLNPHILSVHYDSRKMGPGALFVALRGSDFDGHLFAEHAVAAGAVAILAETLIDVPVPQVIVPDSRAALAIVANAFHRQPSQELQTIGITGTDGKTTTSYLLESILQYAGFKTGVIGTVGIRIGTDRSYDLGHQTTPESILVQGYLREMADEGVDYAIIEATSHGLAMNRLDGTRFLKSGVTNITREHLEFHKTIERYREAKAILIARTGAENGVVVLNADDEGAVSMESSVGSASIVWYSMKGKSAQVSASDIVPMKTSIAFTLDVYGDQIRVELPMIGEFNVANALLAAALAHASGVGVGVIAKALEKPLDIPGRMRMLVCGQPFDVVVDYAHTPESLRKILELLRSLHPTDRLIVVSGSAGQRDEGKRPLQGAACAEIADVSIFTSEDPRLEDPNLIIKHIAEGARGNGAVEGIDFHCITDRRAAVDRAFSLAKPGDCVLLAGKGHETSIIWGYKELPWNEAAVAMELLAKRGYTASS